MSEPHGVALLIDSLGRGGAERVLVDLANRLDRRHYRVFVVTTRAPGPLAASLLPEVELIALGRTRRYDLAAILRFARLMEARGVALVHSHSHTAAYFARLASLLSRKRLAHVVHEHHGAIHSAIGLRLADRLLLRSVDHVFAVSAPLLEYVRHRIGVPASRSEMLPNGVDVVEGLAPAREGPPTVVQVARISAEKDQATAVRAAALLRPDHPTLRWQFIGRTSGRYAEEVRRMAASLGLGNTVSFLGERSDVADVIAGAHVGVLTSRIEGMPVALLEYMGAGLPVVVSDVGECGTLVRASGGGTAVPAEEPGRLADAIAALVRDPEGARRAGERNREFIRTRYSLDGMVRRVETVYARILGSDRAEEDSGPTGGSPISMS